MQQFKSILLDLHGENKGMLRKIYVDKHVVSIVAGRNPSDGSACRPVPDEGSDHFRLTNGFSSRKLRKLKDRTRRYKHAFLLQYAILTDKQFRSYQITFITLTGREND